MKVPGWLLYLAALLPIWIVFSGRFHLLQLGWGLLVALVTLPLSWRLLGLGRRFELAAVLKGLSGVLRTFFVLFVPDAVRSSLDIARRIIQPVIPMAPGIVAIPLRFRGPADELILSNHITLTPGQLLVDVDRERGLIYMHSIDARDPERLRRQITELQRQTLRRIYR